MKNGDYVINYFQDEGMISIGKVINIEGDECDLELMDGSVVSPVSVSDNILIPESLARTLDKCLDQIPIDAGGMFIFKDEE